MAGSLGTLTLDLIAKIGGFTGPMDQAGRAARRSSRESRVVTSIRLRRRFLRSLAWSETSFNRALQSAADMATRTGVSVKAAVETIGQALDAPSQGLTALSKQGFRFTEEQKKKALAMESTGDIAGAQGIILKALEESYGGASAAARDTFGGSLDALQNTISGLLTGEGSLDSAKTAIDSLNEVLSEPGTKVAVDTLAKAAGVLAVVLSARLASAAAATAISLREAVALYHRKLREQPDASKQRDYNDALDVAQASLDATSSRVDILSGKILELNAISLGCVDLSASKVYTEMAKKIDEQILLAGKSSAADKLAARVKAGLVEGLKAGEGDLLISAQKRADAAIKAAEATKKADESAKASAKSAADALVKRGVYAEESYRRQITLIDQAAGTQGKASEVAKLAFEMESGKLKGVSADRQKLLSELAAELDAKVKLKKQNEESLKLAALAANLKDSNTTVKQGFQLELDGAGSGEKFRGRLKENLVVHDATRAQLGRSHAQRIIGITNDGDQGLIALAACQAYTKTVSTPK